MTGLNNFQTLRLIFAFAPDQRQTIQCQTNARSLSLSCKKTNSVSS
jgi:hypothetical protein